MFELAMIIRFALLALLSYGIHNGNQHVCLTIRGTWLLVIEQELYPCGRIEYEGGPAVITIDPLLTCTTDGSYCHCSNLFVIDEDVGLLLGDFDGDDDVDLEDYSVFQAAFTGANE